MVKFIREEYQVFLTVIVALSQSRVRIVHLVWPDSTGTRVFSCSNTEPKREDPDWITWENSLELIKLYRDFNLIQISYLSNINKVSLVLVSSSSNTGSVRDDPNWTSRENSLELIDIYRINIRFV
jgi:hypothetical protein